MDMKLIFMGLLFAIIGLGILTSTNIRRMDTGDSGIKEIIIYGLWLFYITGIIMMIVGLFIRDKKFKSKEFINRNI